MKVSIFQAWIRRAKITLHTQHRRSHYLETEKKKGKRRDKEQRKGKNQMKTNGGKKAKDKQTQSTPSKRNDTSIKYKKKGKKPDPLSLSFAQRLRQRIHGHHLSIVPITRTPSKSYSRDSILFWSRITAKLDQSVIGERKGPLHTYNVPLNTRVWGTWELVASLRLSVYCGGWQPGEQGVGQWIGCKMTNWQTTLQNQLMEFRFTRQD